MNELEELRVVDASSGLAGAYCSKLFADAGAEVVMLEAPEGHPLRAWSATGADLGGRDGAFFRYLSAGKKSVAGNLEGLDGEPELLSTADLVIDDRPPSARDRQALRARHPGLVIVSITPFGLTGPLADAPATDFIIQAECGSLGGRGRPGQEPYQAGGRISEWSGACSAAVAALAAIRHARETGQGELIDFSLHAVTALATNTYLDLMWGILGRPPAVGAFTSIETPSIEPTRDGFVGFNAYTAQQMSDFLLLIERPDLRETGEFNQFAQRLGNLEAWEEVVHGYTREHDTAEIIENAQLLRIPVAPIHDGRLVVEHEQMRARGSFEEDPSGGFQRPVRPYRIDGERPRTPAPAPALGEHAGAVEARQASPAGAPAKVGLPLAGMRILDTTSWWAGPIATHMLAMLGADVIHVESIQRIDGSRSVGGTFSALYDDWWERSFIFLSANTNKRGITLNLADPKGREVLERLIERSDALVENFSPRVMEGFGVTWERVQALNPRCHYVRMPAFGLDGPWREYVGFAATMEQMSGMAWLTGHRDDQPRIQRGPCDPLAGMHAAFALLVAMADRDRDGRGRFIECAMVEAALNVTAEQVCEYTAYGNVMQRQGNRSPEAAPQGLFACAGHQTQENPQWLALSVASDAQWHALVEWLGRPHWATAIPADLASRRARQDEIEAALRALFAERDRDSCIDELRAAGVPVGRVVDPRTLTEHPQFQARGFLEELDHSLVGAQSTMGAPFRYDGVERWLRSGAPTLGQHNAEVLRELGYDDDAIAALKAEKVIGDRPEGV